MRAIPLLPFFAALMLPLGACSSLPDGDGMLAASEGWLSRSGEAIGELFQGGDAANKADPRARREEVEALFDQPYIDPLTRYLEAHAEDVRYVDVLPEVSRERDRRCAAIAERYADRPATRDNLARYRRGYLYSCPADVNAFYGRVREREADLVVAPTPARDPEVPEPSIAGQDGVERAVDRRQANDCYLYFTIRNLQQAREACQGPAERGDARAQHHLGSLARLDGDHDAARRWARQAADQRHAPALVLLAELRREAGELAPGELRRLLQEAAELGSAEAAFRLGESHDQGIDGPVDREAAYLWFSRAERGGDERAAARLEKLAGELDTERRETLRRQAGREPGA